MEGLVEAAIGWLGEIDILINNAGIAHKAPFLDVHPSAWDRTIAVNLRGMFLVAQAVARRMIVRGAGGVIVNMASTNALGGEENFADYNASKGGVLQLTRTMAVELAEHGIRVNCVCPGFIETPLNEAIATEAEMRAYERAKIPLGRRGQPEEIAAAYAFLALGRGLVRSRRGTCHRRRTDGDHVAPERSISLMKDGRRHGRDWKRGSLPKGVLVPASIERRDVDVQTGPRTGRSWPKVTAIERASPCASRRRKPRSRCRDCASRSRSTPFSCSIRRAVLPFGPDDRRTRRHLGALDLVSDAGRRFRVGDRNSRHRSAVQGRGLDILGGHRRRRCRAGDRGPTLGHAPACGRLDRSRRHGGRARGCVRATRRGSGVRGSPGGRSRSRRPPVNGSYSTAHRSRCPPGRTP